MKKTSIITGTGCALTLAASVALAGEMPEFGALDADGDGQISAEEAAANDKLKEMFETADADGSGGVSMEEYTAAAGG